MESKELVSELRYKSKNIKNHTHPKVFSESADLIEKLEKENYVLKNRCFMSTNGMLCLFCPMECEHRTNEFRGHID